MLVMICGSMSFAKQMFESKKELEALGHSVFLPCDADVHIDDPFLCNDLERDAHWLYENEILRKCFQLLADSDAVLFLNYEKNGVKGYLGGSCLMEIGIAYYLKKKIFLLNPLPHSSSARWAHEVSVMRPIVLNGDLKSLR